VSTTIGAMIRLSINLPICMAIHLPVLLPIHLSILLSVGLAVLLPIRLSILLPVRLPINPAIFLSDIRLGEYHVWQDGRGRYSHDQAGNRSGFQQILLHDACSFFVREWVISARWAVIGQDQPALSSSGLLQSTCH
jgi:hypothetical protein